MVPLCYRDVIMHIANTDIGDVVGRTYAFTDRKILRLLVFVKKQDRLQDMESLLFFGRSWYFLYEFSCDSFFILELHSSLFLNLGLCLFLFFSLRTTEKESLSIISTNNILWKHVLPASSKPHSLCFLQSLMEGSDALGILSPLT